MWPRTNRWRLACWLALCCVPWLACSAPDLGKTLFSCATDADCAPGQACLQYQDGLACQRPSASESACTEGSCSKPAPAPGTGLQPAMVDTGATVAGVCREGNCSPSGVSLSTAQREPVRVGPDAGRTDAGASTGAGAGTLDASPDTVAPPLPGGGLDEPGAAAPEATSASIQRDFELSLDGWQSVPDQRPEDTLDGTEQTTELAPHGTGALRMVFDGDYTPVAGATSEDSFYGAYEASAPPPGVEVSLWMLSTAPDVSVEVYSQPDPPHATTTLATVPLLQNEWREIRVIMPLVEARLLGVQVHSPLDLDGFIYLDEIRW